MMYMNKTKKTFRLGALLLIVCLISTVMLSGTFAKYTSEYAGLDTALVARWQFEATDGTTDLNPGSTPTQELDLFSHAYDTNINQKDGADYIIAPGVEDEFTISMTFLSDVNATVTVGFSAAGTVAAGLPIEYLVVNDPTTPTNSDWVNLSGLQNKFASMVVAENPTTTANAVNNTFTFNKSGVDDATVTTVTQKVKWRWAFNTAAQAGNTSTGYISSDTTDTGFGNTSALGGATRTTYILNVSVKADQIQPATI